MRLHRWLALVGAFGSVARSASAQDRSPFSLSGSVRGGYWSSTRELDRRRPLGAGMAWLKATVPLPHSTTFAAESWGALRGPPEDLDATAELREAFLNVSLGPLEIRAGRQILAWGRADGVNPTGNLAAEDFTLLTPDDADRRLGTTTAVASYYLGGLSLSAIWIPEFRGHTIALPATNGIQFAHDRPAWPGDQWAIRAEQAGGAVDWSMSVFRGLDLSPDLSAVGTQNRIDLRHHRVTVLGADATTTVGRFGLRAEGAYTFTEDDAGTDPFTRNPFAFIVIGGDRTFIGRFNVNLQYLVRVLTDFASIDGSSDAAVAALAEQQAILSSQTRRVQHGATIRASYKWLHETLDTEWAAVAYAGPRAIALRPKATYAVTDRVSVAGGAEVFRGEKNSLFRMLRRNSATYVEARWGF
jgi:hypothetical protein